MAVKSKFKPRTMMEKAIAVMRQSINEPRADKKASPLVGAVLVKPDGTIDAAFRGELRHGDPRPFLPRILPSILPFRQDTDDGFANNRRDALPPGGKLKLDVRFEGEMVWLTQQHMARLFQSTKQDVGQHLSEKSRIVQGRLSESDGRTLRIPPNIPPKWRDRSRPACLPRVSRQISPQNGEIRLPNQGRLRIPTTCRDSVQPR